VEHNSQELFSQSSPTGQLVKFHPIFLKHPMYIKFYIKLSKVQNTRCFFLMWHVNKTAESLTYVSCYSAWTADKVKHQELHHNELTSLLKVPVSELNMTAR